MLITVYVDYANNEYLSFTEHERFVEDRTEDIRHSNTAFRNWLDMNYSASEALEIGEPELEGRFEDDCYSDFLDDEDPYERVEVVV